MRLERLEIMESLSTLNLTRKTNVNVKRLNSKNNSYWRMDHGWPVGPSPPAPRRGGRCVAYVILIAGVTAVFMDHASCYEVARTVRQSRHASAA